MDNNLKIEIYGRCMQVGYVTVLVDKLSCVLIDEKKSAGRIVFLFDHRNGWDIWVDVGEGTKDPVLKKRNLELAERVYKRILEALALVTSGGVEE